MKQIIQLVIAGVIGGLITVGGMQWTKTNSYTNIENSAIAKKINHNLNVRAGANAVPFDFAEAAEKATKSVVHIKASESEVVANQRRQSSRNPWGSLFGNPGPRQGSGSGVIIDKNGYIVTNNHVVEFADEVEVTLHDNRTLSAKVVGTYPKADLAVLKIEANGLPVLPNGDSDKARIGEWVLAVGNPLELNSTVTAGIISAKGRSLGVINTGQGNNDKIESFIQTDAAVNPGNSGGALVDAQGNLLGINTAIKSETGYFAGYSFAIPVNLMKKITNDIIQYGSYQRAYLGIRIFDLDTEYAEEQGLNFSQGVVIEGLEDGGSAQYAGLLPGDVIVEVDNKEIKSVPELQEIVGSAKVGEVINVVVNRYGKRKNITVHLKAG